MLPLAPALPLTPLGRFAAQPPFDLGDLDSIETDELIEPEVHPPIRREELDDLVDRVLDEELDRLRDLEEEMKLPPN